MTNITIGRRFCGPPDSGNGGYVCGILATDIAGPATAVLRARIPLDVGLNLDRSASGARLSGAEDLLIGEARPADADALPTPPAPPSLEQASQAGGRYVGLTAPFHPICFTCSPERAEGDGLRIFAGQIEGAPDGHIAGVWTPNAAFADEHGLIPPEIVWAALDCPGYFAWVVKIGRHGGLLGTMTGEILRRPAVGEACIVTAWPISREGRKEFSGVALFSAEGELMARGHQVWISMVRPPQPDAA
jgi:hypothetical protein